LYLDDKQLNLTHSRYLLKTED